MPIPVVHTFGSIQGGALLWSCRGSVVVTVLLKNAYPLSGQLTPLPPDPLDPYDRHYRDDPARTLCTASDYAPRIPRAEVVHVGAVIAPAGVTMARLAAFRGDEALFDKRVVAKATDDSPGFGPIASDVRLVPDEQGVVRLPDDHDFRTHQRAPPNQRCDRLTGGDLLVLGNLHPEIAELRLPMPTRAPVVRAILGERQTTPKVECKRILLDTDRRRWTLLWLAGFQLPDLDAVGWLQIQAQAPDAPAQPFDARELLRKIAATPSPESAPAQESATRSAVTVLEAPTTGPKPPERG